MDIITSLSSAVVLAKRLRDIAKNIEQAEFKNLLADLINELADAKLDAAELKEQMVSLREENRDLKADLDQAYFAAENPPTGVKSGLYFWDGDDGLYCTACWDSKTKKSRVTRINLAGMAYKCPVCNATFSRG